MPIPLRVRAVVVSCGADLSVPKLTWRGVVGSGVGVGVGVGVIVPLPIFAREDVITSTSSFSCDVLGSEA